VSKLTETLTHILPAAQILS